MAEKLAIVTLLTNPEWQPLADLTLPTQRHYAKRIGADFVVIDQRIYPHPHYDKWQLFNLLEHYDRVVYLDADMIVRPDCPDFFVCVPPEMVAGENELLSFPGQAEHLERFCQQLGIPALPCPFYLNGGMFVVSACHRHLFRPPEAVITDLPWPEQSHFNARLIAEKIPVCFLPAVFNDRHRKGDYLRRSYILHYATMPLAGRMVAIRRDLAAWNGLFHRAPRPGSPTTAAAPAITADHDYISPGLRTIAVDRFFPHLTVGDKAKCDWPHLRRDIPHHWYVDRRTPNVGFLNRDEAHILFNTALIFRGQRALEIGCWRGWSACHMALGGVQLDVIDPILERREFHASVSASLESARVLPRVHLVAGSSPQQVHELASQGKGKWSFFFIDGNHDAPHPLQDTIACEAYAADDALMLFHDLVCPDVAQGLDYLKEKGWQTRIYHTMQIMGVAWRGNVQPVHHQADPSIAWTCPEHLKRHEHSLSLPKSETVDQAFFTTLIQKTKNFSTLTWLGQPIWQNVLDLWTIQETITEVSPELLIECGTNRGGSALFYAHLFELVGKGRVVTIDNKKSHELAHERIRFIEGSSISEEVLQKVRDEVAPVQGPIMVILDSDHSKAHVLQELEAYAPFVTKGSFLLVQDGVVDILPIFAKERPGPLGAIHDFLARHQKKFEVDTARCERFLISHHPMGWLRRKSTDE